MATTVFCYKAEIAATLRRVNARLGNPAPINTDTYATFFGVRFRVKGRTPDNKAWVLARTVGVIGGSAGTREIVRTSEEIRRAMADDCVESSFNAQGVLR